MNFATEKEMINYLLTSDFNENLTLEEMKDLLLKYKYLYRSSKSVQNSMEYTIEKLISENEKMREINKKNIKLLEDNKIKYDNVFERKLTFKERILGVIYRSEYNRKFHIFKK